MKLAYRLAAALLAVVLLVFTYQAWIRATGDVDAFELDMRQDHVAMGRSLGNAMAEVWEHYGQARALELVLGTNAREAQLLIEWVWLDDLAGDPRRWPGGGGAIRPLRQAAGHFVADRSREEPRLHSYIPVPTPGPPVGALHLSESLAAERAFVQTTVIRTVAATLIAALFAGLTAVVLGVWFVGRPVRKLIEKARRVGAGDLSGPIELGTRDELAELAREMNAMCDRLAEAQARLREESQTRLEAIEQLRHADRLMTIGKLATAIAHELGTPLNVVSARAQMIVDGEVGGPELGENARSIVEHAEHMAGIIQQLLTYGRPRPPERLPFDLRSVARQTIALLEPVAAKNRVALELACPDVPVVADIDPGQIQQVLTNLIVNGIQAMSRPGSVRVHVRDEARRHPRRGNGDPVRCACLAVADEGEGVSAADLEHIFEPFYTTKAAGAGAGLGLSVTQGIVQEHGGWIEVVSEALQGCTFRVYLPLQMEAPHGPG